MARHEGDPSDLLRNVASDLSIAVDEEILSECSDSLVELRLSTGPEKQQNRPQGRNGTDEYNAFLQRYEDGRSDEAVGPLSGMSLAVKDNIAAKGLQMTCGSSEFELIPSFDATVVERVLSAGAEIVGKTNMDTFGFGPSGEFSGFDQVTNPRNEKLVPGGSSSGSAAAVAAGLVDAAFGTDTGGSVRMPPACCALVGIKPTSSLVPKYGVVDMAPSFDSVGVIADDVVTGARVFETIIGHDHRDPSSRRLSSDPIDVDMTDWDGLRFGIPEAFFDPVSPPVKKAVVDLETAIRDEDAVTVDRVRFSDEFDRERLENSYFIATMTEFSWLLRQSGTNRGLGTGFHYEVLQAFREMLRDGINSEQIARRVLPFAALDAESDGEAYVTARNTVTAFRRELDAIFTDVDILLVPTLRCLPPEYGETKTVDEMVAMNGNNVPFNLADAPAVSVPVDEREGRPVSVQAVAPPLKDDRALRAARFLEYIRESDSRSVS